MCFSCGNNAMFNTAANPQTEEHLNPLIHENWADERLYRWHFPDNNLIIATVMDMVTSTGAYFYKCKLLFIVWISGIKFVDFYHLGFLDYCLHLYCYIHNVLADKSSDLLQVFLVKLGSLHETSNHVLYSINRGHLLWFCQP